jgi:transposase InsO family protein
LLGGAVARRWAGGLGLEGPVHPLRPTVAEAQPVFARLFREFGLPERIRTDNGVPFATTTLARLSSLSAFWVRLGILPDLIEPGKPQQNGRHESQGQGPALLGAPRVELRAWQPSR